jgi:HEAT repeat protein
MKKPIWLALGLTIIVVGTGFLLYMTIGPGGREANGPPKPPDERAQVQQLLQKWSGMDEAARKAAVPALVRALRSDDENIRLGVVLALGKGAPDEVNAAFVGALQDQDENVRYYAAWALGRMAPASPEAFSAILAAVKDRNADVRRKAAWALAQLNAKPEQSVPCLTAALDDKDIDVREQAADSLAVFGKAAVPPLLDKLKASDKEPRRLAIRAVRQIGPTATDAIPLLRAQLLDPESGLQDEAAAALAHIGKPAIPVLVEALKGDDGPMLRQVMTGFGSFWAMAAIWHDPAVQRRQAINALGSIGTETLDVLLDALQDRHSDVREQAAGVLGSLGYRDRRIVLPLAERLRDPSDSVRAQAAWALRGLSPDVRLLLPELQQAVADPNAAVRLHAVTFLGSLGAPALPLLLQAFKDKDLAVQRQALAMLQETNVDSETLISAVAPLLLGDNADLRRDAVAVLHRCGSPALPYLIQALRDPSAEVREQVVLALQDVGADDKELHQALLQASKDKDAFVRAGALAALLRFGPQSLPQIEAGMKDQSPLVRKAAAGALGRLSNLKTVPLLIAALGDEDDKVWDEARKSLTDMRADNRKLLPLLKPALKSPERSVRKGTAFIMRRFGADAVPLLLEALKDPDPGVNYAAAYALDDIGGPARPAIPALVDAATTHADKKVRDMARKALMKMHGQGEFWENPKDGVPGLVDLLEATDASTRYGAAVTLGVIGPPAQTAIPALSKALKDPSPSVAQAAQYALERIKNEPKD